VAMLDVVIDTLIRYTFETATLTCAGTIASMLCVRFVHFSILVQSLNVIYLMLFI
jgi:hypothetical protein